MTKCKWRDDILKVCKYCRHFIDVQLFRKGGNRHMYQCDKHGCSIYAAPDCGKLASIRKLTPEIEREQE